MDDSAIMCDEIIDVEAKLNKETNFNGKKVTCIFSKVNGHLEEINGNKYLTLVPTNKSKEKKL